MVDQYPLKMHESKLVAALRSGNQLEVLVALLRSAYNGSSRTLYSLDQIKPLEARILTLRGGIATRLALSYHPDRVVPENALYNIKPKEAAELQELMADAAARIESFGTLVELLGLTRHASGYVREVALLATEPGDGTPLEAFLRLSNDWVPAIAWRAQRKASVALSKASDDDLARALPVVYGLNLGQRVNLRMLVDEYFDEVLRRPDLVRRVRRWHRWGKVGLWAYQVFSERSNLVTDPKEDINDPNALVQLAAARRLIKDPQAWPQLMASRLPRIRQMGLDIAPLEAREAALLDTNFSVRNDARFLLGKRDFADIYRRHLPSLGAISGLGETGKREDAILLTPLLIDEKSEVRRRALEAYERLLGDDALTELLVALQDPSRKVQRVAISGLCGRPVALEPNHILDLDLGIGGTWRLVDRCGRWQGLIAVMKNHERFPSLEGWLRRWAIASRSRPFPPSPDQLEEASNLLPQIAGAVSQETIAELRNAISTWVRK